MDVSLNLLIISSISLTNGCYNITEQLSLYISLTKTNHVTIFL